MLGGLPLDMGRPVFRGGVINAMLNLDGVKWRMSCQSLMSGVCSGRPGEVRPQWQTRHKRTLHLSNLRYLSIMTH